MVECIHSGESKFCYVLTKLVNQSVLIPIHSVRLMTTAEKTFRTDLSKGFYVLNILVKNLQSNFLVSLSYDEKLL